MADTPQTLTFLAWARPEISTLATAPDAGRLQAATTITLTEAHADGAPVRSETRPVSFLLAGPADVVGLQPGAIVRRYPAPGTLDHESDRCPYVELGDPTLPWRYTSAPTPAGANLHPWLVLVVGQEGSELTLAGGQVTIEVGAQQGEQALGDPRSAYRFAHVQQDAAGHRVTRILCGRPLLAGTDYLAALVPAFDPTGAPSWTGTAPVTVPAYDVWRFRTAVPAGSFEDLAARLVPVQPGDVPPTTGRAPLRYPRLADAPELGVLGALTTRSADHDTVEDPLPADVQADLAALQLPAHDPQGRPLVALPRYGQAWPITALDQSRLDRDLNLDPRHRGIAGLGLEVGIRAQEDLVDDVLAHLGSLQEARQRVRHLTLGLAASRSLWQRRVPTDPAARLWLLGPSLNRLVTTGGVVGDLATAEDRTIARGTFSAAARRVLRAGPARTALSAAALTPAALVASVNRPAPALPAGIDGIPIDDAGLKAFDSKRSAAIHAGHVDTTVLLNAAIPLVDAIDNAVHQVAGRLLGALREAAAAATPAPWAQALALLAAGDAAVVAHAPDPAATRARLTRDIAELLTTFTGAADDADLTQLLADLGPLTPADPLLRPVDVDALAAGIGAVFDPTTDDAPAAIRVLATVDGGVDPAQPLAPPEPCVGLDRAAWADLAAMSDEWLLPGAGQLPANSVLALQSNPVFIDAYLTGLNTQLLGELRWRNIPVATGCTPIRRFWARTDTSTGQRSNDVVGLASWPSASALGDPTHRPPGGAGRELVIAVRGDLLLRYPTTLVYLQSAVRPGATAADFDADPADSAPRVLPGFRGRLGADLAFFGFPGELTALADHWLVFEEPPAGYRFHNDIPTTASTGHEWAVTALAQPVRVLIRGDFLQGGGHT
jgi:hypothetical protein